MISARNHLQPLSGNKTLFQKNKKANAEYLRWLFLSLLISYLWYFFEQQSHQKVLTKMQMRKILFR